MLFSRRFHASVEHANELQISLKIGPRCHVSNRITVERRIAGPDAGMNGGIRMRSQFREIDFGRSPGALWPGLWIPSSGGGPSNVLRATIDACETVGATRLLRRTARGDSRAPTKRS